jgi:hypothetical protein
LTLDGGWAQQRPRRLVTSEALGVAVIPSLPFQNVDGGPIRIDRDFFGRLRSAENPFPGPFELPAGGRQTFKVF